MTIEQIIEELKFVDHEITVCKNTINNPKTEKKEKADCRERLRENYHQKMHLESVLASVKYDPLF